MLTHSPVKPEGAVPNKRIEMLVVEFDLPLQPYEIYAFRGAVAKAVGFENDLFHNHNEEGFLHRYPLVQYRSFNKRAGILFLQDGMEEIMRFFNRGPLPINLNSNKIELKLKSLNREEAFLGLLAEGRTKRFRLWNYAGINQENYGEYQRMTDEERVALLQRTITAHLLHLCRTFNIWVEGQISVQVEPLLEHRWVTYKNGDGFRPPIKLNAFNLNFHTNLNIPKWLGIGKGASRGFGVIT